MRSKRAKKRILKPDSLYHSQLVTRLINRIMKQGKKSAAEKMVYQAFSAIKEKTKKDPLEIFTLALENTKPDMEVRPRRVGGASYQVPIPVRGDRKEALAISWLIIAAHNRPSKEYRTYENKLAAEILAASNKEGNAVKKKEDIHRTAEANKAFAHFRW